MKIQEQDRIELGRNEPKVNSCEKIFLGINDCESYLSFGTNIAKVTSQLDTFSVIFRLRLIRD